MWIKRPTDVGRRVVSKGCAYLVYLLHQCVIQKWFFNDGHARLGGTGAQHLVWLTDYENSGGQHFALAQLRNQLHPAHPRHALIDDKTAAIMKLAGGEKFPAAAIGAHSVT